MIKYEPPRIKEIVSSGYQGPISKPIINHYRQAFGRWLKVQPVDTQAKVTDKRTNTCD